MSLDFDSAGYPTRISPRNISLGVRLCDVLSTRKSCPMPTIGMRRVRYRIPCGPRRPRSGCWDWVTRTVWWHACRQLAFMDCQRRALQSGCRGRQRVTDGSWYWPAPGAQLGPRGDAGGSGARGAQGEKNGSRWGSPNPGAARTSQTWPRRRLAMAIIMWSAAVRPISRGECAPTGCQRQCERVVPVLLASRCS